MLAHLAGAVRYPDPVERVEVPSGEALRMARRLGDPAELLDVGHSRAWRRHSVDRDAVQSLEADSITELASHLGRTALALKRRLLRSLYLLEGGEVVASNGEMRAFAAQAAAVAASRPAPLPWRW